MQDFLCTKCGSIPKGPGTLRKVLISIIISWEGSRFPLRGNSVWGSNEPETSGEQVITTMLMPVARKKDRQKATCGESGLVQGGLVFPFSLWRWIISSKWQNTSSGFTVKRGTLCGGLFALHVWSAAGTLEGLWGWQVMVVNENGQVEGKHISTGMRSRWPWPLMLGFCTGGG